MIRVSLGTAACIGLVKMRMDFPPTTASVSYTHLLRQVSELCLQKAAYARQKISALNGFEQAFSGIHFKEFAIKLPVDGGRLNRYLLQHNILGGFNLEPYYPELGPAMLCLLYTSRCV